MRPPRRALSSLLSIALVAACQPGGSAPDPRVGSEEPRAADASARPAVAATEPVAELIAVRGPAGVRTDDLPEGTFLGPGARLRAGQRLVVPPGTLAELRLQGGTLLRLNEDTRLTVPDGRALELDGGELVALVAAGEPPLRVRAGADTLDLTRGEARVWSRGDRRRYDMVYGTARLRSEGRELELSPGAHVETPLAPAPSERPAAPAVSLRPLAETAWSRAFDVAAAQVEAVPAGVGSLTARRAGSSATLHRLALTEQKVHVAISGRIARTEVEQTFYNEASEVLEGTYRFPLPADASIAGLSLLVGDTWMDAEMLEKQRARAIFKKIVDATIPRDPALLEWEQGNIFKMRIFPIPGRGARKIRLSYTQVLPAVGDTLRYRYPIAGSSSGAAGEEIGAFEFTVAVDRAGLPADADIATPMARLERRVLADRIELSTRESGFRPVHDLGVDLPLTAGEQRVHAETHLDGDGQAYFMLALKPDLSLPPDDRPTHYAFVLDRSHSMTPELWTVARTLVQAMAGALDPDDRMTVLACDAACDVAPGGLAPASAALPAADAFLDPQALAGASDLGGMMRAAAAALDDTDDPKARQAERVIVYLGDGNPTAGELAPDELLRHLERPLAGVRVQAVALGARSDLLLLDALTRGSGGDLLRADARDDLRGLVRELRLRAEVPVAREVELSLPPGLVYTHPRRPAALRPGDTVLLVGKLAGPVHGPLEIHATGPNGHVSSDKFQIDLEAAPGAAGARHAHLPRTWARLEIDDLTTTRGHGARGEIVGLSRQYNVLSRYTALIALENDAMYREFGVARQARSSTGWDGQLGGPPQAPTAAPENDREASEDARSARDARPDADPPRRESRAGADELESSGATLDDALGGLTGSGRGGGGTGEGTIGLGHIGVGSGHGSGYGSGSGGFGGRGGRLVPRWTFEAADAPGRGSLDRLETLRQAVERDPTSRPAHRQLVQQAIRLGAPEAFTYATAWAQADPDHAPALLAVADLLAARGDAIAPRAYASAVEVDPFDARQHTRLAESLAFKGDLARSCAHRRAVVSIDPARPEHHLQLVRCLTEQGRAELARAAAEDGLARARGNTAALRAALTSGLPPIRPARVTGDLEATLTWTGDADLDIAFVDPRGRRLSALRREGLRVEQLGNREIAALPVESPQTLAVEVTRFGGQGPAGGELRLRAGGETRSYPFTIDQGSLRLASATYSLVSSASPGVRIDSQAAQVKGGLDRNIVLRIIRAHLHEVRYCYYQALQRDPGARGRLNVQFVINDAGKVLSSAVRDSTLKDPGVGHCAAAAVRRWTFPRPENGGIVTVTYPFLFDP